MFWEEDRRVVWAIRLGADTVIESLSDGGWTVYSLSERYLHKPVPLIMSRIPLVVRSSWMDRPVCAIRDGYYLTDGDDWPLSLVYDANSPEKLILVLEEG